MIKENQKLLCANNLVGMVVTKLMKMCPEKSQCDIMVELTQTETYRQLYDFGTALWQEGPDYLLSLLGREVGRSSEAPQAGNIQALRCIPRSMVGVWEDA